jgi:hypothetical protein
MNLKTTLALVVLVAAGVALVWSGGQLPDRVNPFRVSAPAQEQGTLEALEKLNASRLERIEVRRGDQVTRLERTKGGDWVMPGNWPTRTAEVRRLVALLTDLHSRFEPLLVTDEDLEDYGLKRPAVTVTVRAGDEDYKLEFGEEPGGNRIDRPTYLRVNGNPEVLRLAPGLIAALDKPADYYQQRRLFPAERAPKEEGGPEKVDRLTATSVTVESANNAPFTLRRTKDGWELASPQRDALDPRSRDAFLEAVPDVWAERFLPPDNSAIVSAWGWALGGPAGNPGAAATAVFLGVKQPLAERGLLEPERTLIVTPADGSPRTLYVGRPTLDPRQRDRSFARLKGFDRVFEIRTDKFKDIFVGLDLLRDNQLARFKPDDARTITITADGQTVELRNENEKPNSTERGPANWKIVRPVQASADAQLVGDLLNKLSGLSAQEKDVGEKTRLAAVGLLAAAPRTPGDLLPAALLGQGSVARAFGLEKPAATVVVTVEEKVKGEKTPKKRTHTIQLGRHDRTGKKLYAKADDWPRINEVDDSLADLVLGRKPVDYRGKRLFDFAADDLQRISVTRSQPAGKAGGGGRLKGLAGGLAGAAVAGTHHPGRLTLERVKGEWRLTAPVQVEADAERVRQLAERLGKLEVVQYVADKAGADELKKYGLVKPALRVELEFSDKKKPPRTLLIGNERRGQPGRYAKLENAPEIFALADDVCQDLERDALVYRPAELWKLKSNDPIVKLQIDKAGQAPYSLTLKDNDWQVSGPFTVTAPRDEINQLTAALASPRAKSYKAHSATNLKPFGLDKPEVKLTLTTKGGVSHGLLLGAPADGGRYAKLANGPAVFVAGADLVKAADHSALDFLDRRLLKFDAGAVTQLDRRSAGGDVLELAKKEDAWHLVKPSDQPADEQKVPDLLRKLGDLTASRIVAYPAKDLKKFGLEKPTAVLTMKLTADEKPRQHVVELGGLADQSAGDRYALVDHGKAVAVLPGAVVRSLLAGPLALRDHNLARFADADKMRLEYGSRKATFGKVEGSWKLVEPLTADADDPALDAFLNSLARLRADELVADKPTPAQLKEYGLLRPTARWRLSSGETEVLDLSVGAAEKGGKRRYAKLANKPVVFLLEPKLSESVLAEYRPRSVWKEPIDSAQVEAIRFGYPAGAFELRKVDDRWEVAGKPGAKVNAEAVNQTLAALRDPKMVRYAVDKGADLAVYGLKPAELVLEVTTPSGKRTLWVGGREGTSKRRYAHVPEAGRSDVFILSEEDATRLVRDLKAFTGGAGR